MSFLPFWHFTQKWAFAYASIKTTFQSCEHKRLRGWWQSATEHNYIIVLTHFKQVQWDDGVGKGHSHCKKASDTRAYEGHEGMGCGIFFNSCCLRRCQRVANHVPALSSGLADTTPQVVENTCASCLPGWRRGSSWVFHGLPIYQPLFAPLAHSMLIPKLDCHRPLVHSPSPGLTWPWNANLAIKKHLPQEILQAIPWHLITLLWNHTVSPMETMQSGLEWLSGSQKTCLFGAQVQSWSSKRRNESSPTSCQHVHTSLYHVQALLVRPKVAYNNNRT